MASATVTRSADGLAQPVLGRPPAATAERGGRAGRRARWVSPLLRRILLVNALPLVLLVAVLLYLDQYQTGLLQAEVLVLREQARIYAGALGESAVRLTASDAPRMNSSHRRSVLPPLRGLPLSRMTFMAAGSAFVSGSRPVAGSRGTWRSRR